jgi:hypothetical protein
VDHSAAQRMTEPATRAATTDGRKARFAPDLIVAALNVSSAAVAVAGIVAALARGDALRLRTPFLGYFLVPHAAILALLLWRRRAAGLAMATAFGGVGALALAFPAAVLLIFSGFDMGEGGTRWPAVYVVLLIAMSVAGIVGYRMLDPALRRGAHLSMAFAAALVYAAVAVPGYPALQSRVAAQKRTAAANQEAAWRTVSALAACLSRAAASAANGFPESLAPSGQVDAGCTANLPPASGGRLGYRYQYWAALPAPDGRVHSFLLCATPVSAGITGFTTIAADERQILPPSAREYREFGRPPPSCSGMWAGQPEELVRHCAMQYARRADRGSYPAAVAVLGPKGDGCLVGEWGSPQSAGGPEPNALYFGDQVVVYAPGKPGPDGRITAFEISTRVKARDDWVDVMVDESGGRHMAVGRKAKRSDPTYESLVDVRAAQDLRESRNESELDAACQQGHAPSCEQLGWLSHLKQRTDDAARAWKRGCALAPGESCVLKPSDIDSDVQTIAIRYKYRCAEQGDGDACERLARYAAQVIACERGEGAACGAAAWTLEDADLIGASGQLWGRGCRLGDRESCYLGQAWPYDERGITMRLKRLCLAGDAAACNELAAGMREFEITEDLRKRCAATSDPAICRALSDRLWADQLRRAERQKRGST